MCNGLSMELVVNRLAVLDNPFAGSFSFGVTSKPTTCRTVMDKTYREQPGTALPLLII
jgi:hypothetical protein